MEHKTGYNSETKISQVLCKLIWSKLLFLSAEFIPELDKMYNIKYMAILSLSQLVKLLLDR